MLQTIEDADLWRKTISEFPTYDFYHTWDYHQLSKKEGETPILFYFKQENIYIALPLLKRPIPDTDYFDLTSVYGYAGPLSKGIDQNFDNSTFAKGFAAFMNENSIITIFSRLNPFIPMQEFVLKGIGRIETLGPMVNVDLTLDLDTQRTKYSKTTKRYVNRLRRTCDIVKASTKEDVNKFIDLYTQTMERVDAKDYYFFDEAYYHRFMESRDFNVDLLMVKLKETGALICGAMMVKTNNIVQYHLSGTSSEYLNITPLRLLIDETRIQATNNGFKYFNLGGGLGSQEDSLFYFKSSISKDTRDFSVWKYVVNPEIYTELSRKKRMQIEDKSEFDKSTFFPSYRM